MRWGRVRYRDGQVRRVRVEGDIVVPLDATDSSGPTPLSDVTVLCPVTPSKVVCVASNYRAHAIEMGKAVPSVPKIFLKPDTSVVGPGEAIELPPGTNRVDHEAELAVVIGRTATRVSVSDAMSYVAGYTICNDVTARDLQQIDGVFGRAKGFDTFCPLGPWVVSGILPHDLRVQCFVDGVLRQDGRTSDMVFGIARLISFISHIMTLREGDVIATGTPAGVGPLVAGQTVSIVVEQVGELHNPVVDRVDRVPAQLLGA